MTHLHDDCVRSEIENIPRSNFTTTNKIEIDERILEDKTNKSNVIINNDEDNPDSEIVLIACDGSLTQLRLRISTATAVIFAENSILNEEFTTSVKKSSSELEIIGAFSVIIKSNDLNLKRVAIS